MIEKIKSILWNTWDAVSEDKEERIKRNSEEINKLFLKHFFEIIDNTNTDEINIGDKNVDIVIQTCLSTYKNSLKINILNYDTKSTK